MFAVVSEVLAHRAARVGSQVLQGSSVGRRRAHDDRVLHGVGLGQSLDQLGDGRPLLTDGDVDAVELRLLVRTLVETLLVDDRVDGDRRLAANAT